MAANEVKGRADVAPALRGEHPLGALRMAARPSWWMVAKAALVAAAIVLVLPTVFAKLQPWALTMLAPMKSLKPEWIEWALVRCRWFLQVLALLSALAALWRRFATGVSVRERGLVFTRGLVWRREILVPAAGVGVVQMAQGPIQRRLDAGDLKVEMDRREEAVAAGDLAGFGALAAAMGGMWEGRRP